MGLYLGLLSLFPLAYYNRMISLPFTEAFLPTDTFDDTYYLGLISDGIAHDSMTSNHNHPEHAAGPMVRPGWLEWIWGRTSRVLGLDIRSTYWAGTALCAMLSCLGWWLMGRALGMGSSASALGAFLVLTTTIGMYAFRPVHPQLSLPLFLLFEAALSSWWKSRHRYILVAFSIFLALNCYGYPHFWTLGCIHAFLLGCTLIFRRDWIGAGFLTLATLAALGAAYPVWHNLMTTLADPAYPDLMFRLGHDTSGAPLFSFSLTALLVLAVLGSRGACRVWLVSLACGLLLCTNMQVITGHAASPSRWIWYVGKPFLLLIVMTILGERILRWKAWKGRTRLGTTLVLVIAGSLSLALQIKDAIESGRIKWVDRNGAMAPVMHWMSRNLPPDSVVAAPHLLSPHLRVYAGLNAYNCGHGQAQLIFQKEYSERLDSQDYLQGMTLENYTEALDKYLAHRTSLHYGSHFHRQSGGYENVPDSIRRHLIEGYAALLASQQEGPWKPRFACDYVVIETANENPVTLKPHSTFKPERIPGTKIWEDTHYSVWQIR